MTLRPIAPARPAPPRTGSVPVRSLPVFSLAACCGLAALCGSGCRPEPTTIPLSTLPASLSADESGWEISSWTVNGVERAAAGADPLKVGRGEQQLSILLTPKAGTTERSPHRPNDSFLSLRAASVQVPLDDRTAPPREIISSVGTDSVPEGAGWRVTTAVPTNALDARQFRLVKRYSPMSEAGRRGDSVLYGFTNVLIVPDDEAEALPPIRPDETARASP